MIIRILTEDKNPELIRHHCAKTFEAFTMYRGLGYWKGNPEPSVTIEIAVIPPANLSDMAQQARTLAQKIKQSNQQESVLIEFVHATAELL